MTELPLKPKYIPYKGGKRDKIDDTSRKNQAIDRITKYANSIIADNPEQLQRIFFQEIAQSLNCNEKLVWQALSEGRSDHLSVYVSKEDREALAPFKTE